MMPLRDRGQRQMRTIPLTLAIGIALVVAVACDREPTAPPEIPISSARPARTVTPGTLAVYTDRTAWLAAVAAEGGTAQEYDYTGLTMGRITSRSVDYGPFRIAVDVFSSSTFSNPGIDSIPDLSCSLGTGTCNRMIYNMIDPSFSLTPPFDMPRVDSLVMPQKVLAFGATFGQTGIAVGCTGCPQPTGPTSIHFGGASYVLNDAVPTGGGFIGFIAGTPDNVITFTYAQGTSTWANDLIEVYRPEFANSPITPASKIGDLRTYIAGAGLAGPIAKKLDGSLQKALDAVNANQTSVACSNLQDVIDFTNKQSDTKIPPAVKSQIISQTNAIRTDLGC